VRGLFELPGNPEVGVEAQQARQPRLAVRDVLVAAFSVTWVDAAVGEAPAAELAAAVFQIVQVCACTPETATLALDATVDIESAVDLILTGFFNDLQVE
jgi:hypothetical protein